MRDHFFQAGVARDAVVSGRLEDVRASLRALAMSPPSSEAPNDWLPWLEDMRVTAGKGAQAGTLEEAAASVAGLANACGECHRTTRGGLRSPARKAQNYDPEGKKGLEEKMARHKFSADALWLGLTGPAHQAWAEGASALMNIQVPGLVDEHGMLATKDRRPSGEGSLQGSEDPRIAPQDHDVSARARPGAVDLDAALRQLRGLGTAADQAKTAAEKQAVFGQLISRCGSCHAALGVRLPDQNAREIVRARAASAAPSAATSAPKRVAISADKIVITEKIQFDFNAATIKSESHPLLDEIVAVMKANPQLSKISIEGHTDSDGAPGYNLKLSRERAASVLRYLTEHGVEPGRLVSTGFGAERPIASNDDAEGKERNRRVEFLINQQHEVKSTYELDPKTGERRLIETVPRSP